MHESASIWKVWMSDSLWAKLQCERDRIRERCIILNNNEPVHQCYSQRAFYGYKEKKNESKFLSHSFQHFSFSSSIVFFSFFCRYPTFLSQPKWCFAFYFYASADCCLALSRRIKKKSKMNAATWIVVFNNNKKHSFNTTILLCPNLSDRFLIFFYTNNKRNILFCTTVASFTPFQANFFCCCKNVKFNFVKLLIRIPCIPSFFDVILLAYPIQWLKNDLKMELRLQTLKTHVCDEEMKIQIHLFEICQLFVLIGFRPKKLLTFIMIHRRKMAKFDNERIHLGWIQ